MVTTCVNCGSSGVHADDCPKHRPESVHTQGAVNIAHKRRGMGARYMRLLKSPESGKWYAQDEGGQTIARGFASAEACARAVEHELETPPVAGPHKLWIGHAADIWNSSVNTWQAWTWEIRCAKLPAGRRIVCWTCPPHIFDEIRAIADSAPADTAWYEFLFGCYVPGGISQMFATHRSVQAVS